MTSALPKLLMVTHRLPYPPHRGDRIRNWHVLEQLSTQFEVYLACPTDEPIYIEAWLSTKKRVHALAVEPLRSPIRHAYRQMRALAWTLRGASLTEGLFYSRALKHEINNWVRANRIEVLWSACSSTWRYVHDLEIPVKVMDFMDVDSAKWAQLAAIHHQPMRGIYHYESEHLRMTERAILERFDMALVTNDREAALLQSRVGDRPVQVMANGVDLAYFTPTPLPGTPSLVFVGALDYAPNIEGIHQFVMRLWPLIKGRYADATLQIVGRCPSLKVQRLARQAGVSVHGSVPDVRPFIAGARVAVVPLNLARGIQNKALEAMACGRPVIVSPAVAEGLHAEPGRELLIAEDQDQWLEQLWSLFDDTGFAESVADAGLAYVRREHQWSSCLAPAIHQIHARLAGLGDRVNACP